MSTARTALRDFDEALAGHGLNRGEDVGSASHRGHPRRYPQPQSVTATHRVMRGIIEKRWEARSAGTPYWRPR